MEVLLDLDFYFACGTYSLKYNCHMPNMNSLGNVNLINARHPLINQSEVVPVNIKINEFKPILMITGPNTGGKTVALKTLGLLTMMAQTGLLIPASSESDVSIFSGIYADIEIINQLNSRYQLSQVTLKMLMRLLIRQAT